MNDGSALSGTYTLTNASAIVQGNSSADTSEIAVGDIVIDDNGDKVRVVDIQPNRVVGTSNVDTSNEINYNYRPRFCSKPRSCLSSKWWNCNRWSNRRNNTFLLMQMQVQTHLHCLQLKVVHYFISLELETHHRLFLVHQHIIYKLQTFGESTNSGSSCTVTRPPVELWFLPPHIDANILGITSGESLRWWWITSLHFKLVTTSLGY